MNNKSEFVFFILLRIFVGIAIVGLIVLFLTNLEKRPSDVAFSLIAFIISVAALVMTTLQSVSILRQVKVTQKAAKLVKESSDMIELLIKEDKTMERALREDLALDREIIVALEEHGIGNNEEERKAVAKTIKKRLRRR
ncbi:hypothetical protein A3F64_02455 [Candidatus Saccharibacteria bacterium RIFCSPHIGHO2_12_FULL_42_8]|nr:MAG: hypothetical protein A3F64_02455 [Candidatus Saccharibacteria bacterium RIFCSPHIGHO2_12_FULL_42_8]